MTEQEFNEFIEEQKKAGKSEEDIVKIFCLMFKDGKLPREQLEAVIEALGYEMSDELKALGDEELKEKIITKSEEGDEKVTEEDKIDPDGEVPPPATEKVETEEETKEETKEEKEDGEESEEEERKKAMRLFGLEK